MALNTIPLVFQQQDLIAGSPLLDTATTTIPNNSFLTIFASTNGNCSGLLVASTIDRYIGVYEGTNLRAIIPPGWTEYLGVRFGVGTKIQIKSLNGVATDIGYLSIQLVQT